MEHLRLPANIQSSFAECECVRVKGDGANSPNTLWRCSRDVEDTTGPHRFVTAIGICVGPVDFWHVQQYAAELSCTGKEMRPSGWGLECPSMRNREWTEMSGWVRRPEHSSAHWNTHIYQKVCVDFFVGHQKADGRNTDFREEFRAERCGMRSWGKEWNKLGEESSRRMINWEQG